jgi:hypothetical protein
MYPQITALNVNTENVGLSSILIVGFIVVLVIGD